MECYPKLIIAPLNVGEHQASKVTITKLDEIRTEACQTDNKYIATIRFFLKTPTNIPCSIIFPGYFCEYILYANNAVVSSTKTFNNNNPVYPSSNCIDLPVSDDGLYEIVMNIITPSNSVIPTSSAFLFGATNRIRLINKVSTDFSIGFCGALLVLIATALLQYVVKRRDRRIASFIFLCFAEILCVLFNEDSLIVQFIPGLPYQFGTILKSMCLPVLFTSIIYHSYCMFPTLAPKHFTVFVSILQIIPVVNSLTLGTIPVFGAGTKMSNSFAFILLILICTRAHSKKMSYGIAYAIGAELFIVSGLMETSTIMEHSLSMIIHFSPVVIFAIIELHIFASHHSIQIESEKFYTEELNKTLEAMQASESAFLNAQMKPHFLYNTLNTIADLCVADPDKARGLIGSLTDYCKLIMSIDNMKKTVPLSREMELVTAYTNIEHERFPSISFYTDCPTNLPRVDIPPLTLQPLIENAIKHGVRKLDRPGVITLQIKDNYDKVTFVVSDNGCGMSEETIGKLFNKPKENQSIGVYNIDKRLKNLYQRGLEVESTIGFGTSVSFTVSK